MTQNRIYVLLGMAGVLLLLIGMMLSYFLFLSDPVERIVEVSTEAQATASTYAFVAPDNYTKIMPAYDTIIPLPEPVTIGTRSVEEAIATRRSGREYADSPVSLADAGQMLWAGIGQTASDGKRTNPSPGSTNPTRMFLVAHNVESLEPGIYEYLNDQHALGLVQTGYFRPEWANVTAQTFPGDAPAVALVSGDMFHLYSRFGENSARLVYQETGHIGQNLYLQANSLGLNMIVLGNYDTDVVNAMVGLSDYEPVLYLVPFGNKPDTE